MGFSTGGSRQPHQSMNEINVTPFVDVMLVLLIVFMISAPLLQSGVDVDLPEGNKDIEQKQDSLIVSIDRDGKYYLDDKYLQLEVLVENIQNAVKSQNDRTVYLRGDRQIPYGTVMALINKLNAAGIDQVSLITQPESEP